MQNKPIIVGITGGIGSGKTTVCKVFETLGIVAYYADDRAKWLMEHDSRLMDNIKRLFGEQAYTNGRLDRAYLAGLAFQNPKLLDQLNALVHPAVGEDFAKWVKANQEKPILLKEAALLFETGSYRQLHKNILVVAPESLRITRVLSRDPHRSESDVKDIISRQMQDEEKLPLADFVIYNDGRSSVIKQVMEIYHALIHHKE